MKKPSLEDIFAEPDEFNLLDVKPASLAANSTADHGLDILEKVHVFYQTHQRLPHPEAQDHAEMRLGTIWDAAKRSPTDAMRQADTLGLLTLDEYVQQRSWRDAPHEDDIPESLDALFDDDELVIDETLSALKHTTPAAERHQPDHRADVIPCRNFAHYQSRFEAIQQALDDGTRKALTVKKWSVIEPLEGDVFIRNGLLAFIAEKSEMTARGGSRDHRLRIIFSNGTESSPLMSSFRKSLNEDKTARIVQKTGFGPLDPQWEKDRLSLSGTIYVARSLSSEPAIQEQRTILHKIGVTSQDVHRRVADARNDPTFLLAPVEIVATYSLKDLSRHKVEHLLHRFFAPARPAQLFITDRFGKTVRPQEWFYVLPDHVAHAAQLIQEGTLHLYHYDVQSQTIVLK